MDQSELCYAPPEKTEKESLLFVLVNLGSYILQFLSLWTTRRNNAKGGRLAEMPTPKAPTVDKNTQDTCPLCRQNPIQTPTILPICGYAFCYRCISTHVELEGSCPISGIPADLRSLIRIF